MAAVTEIGANDGDSAAAPVSTFNLSRSNGFEPGDFIVVLGWANTTADWDLGASDGVQWTKMLKYGNYQVWGKVTGPSAGSVTVFDFAVPTVVHKVGQVYFRNAQSFAHAAQVLGYGANRLQAPQLFPTGPIGRQVRVYGLVPTGDNDPYTLDSTGSKPLQSNAVSWMYAVYDRAYTGAGNVGYAYATTGGRTFNLASAVTITLNEARPPNAPIRGVPPNLAILDPTLTQRFSWFYSDPDPGDAQSKFNFRYSDDAGATWTTITRTTPNNFWDAPPGTFVDGVDYEWQVRTYDQSGLVGPYTPSRFFSAVEAPDVPAITYPASGGTVGELEDVTWSVTDQEYWEIRRVGDDSDGNADTSIVYFDHETIQPDWVTRRFAGLPFEVSGRYEHIQLRVKVDGVWSDWADVRVLASFTPPPTAELVVTFNEDGRSIDLNWTTPAPDEDDEDTPAATSARIFYSTDGGVTQVGPIAAGLNPDGTFTYRFPASGVDHSFRIMTVADSQASAVTEWITLYQMTADEVV